MSPGDIQDLLHHLEGHPGDRRRFRSILFADDPGATDAFQRLAAALASLAERVEELAQAQARTEKRVEELAQAQARTERRVEELAQAHACTEIVLQNLVRGVDSLVDLAKRHDNLLARLKGDLLEIRYRERAASYFGALLRKARVFDHSEFEPLRDLLSEEEFQDLLNLDLAVSGRVARRPEVGEVLLAVEVSSVIDPKDVSRSWRRASLLRRLGKPVVPAVAGESLTDDAGRDVVHHHVAVFQDGSVSGWEEALQAALGER